ncbi:hypothetical protein R5R35_013691 [Gryllus longicercus]|uniref:Uncharacterized protein n=1 Tax=Gryllus longicercus TaxID=2509291 RepID=A0AAN9ZBR3_9ORTH
MFQAKGVEIKLPATYLAPWKATAAELLPALCEQGGDCSDPSATALEEWKISRRRNAGFELKELRST